MSEEEARISDGRNSGFGTPVDPEQLAADELLIEELTALIPGEIAVLILRAANAEMDAKATPEQRALAAQMKDAALRELKGAGKVPDDATWRDVEKIHIHKESQVLRRELVTQWLSLFGRIWGIPRDPDLLSEERTVPLDHAFLPLARTNALIQHGSSDWYGPLGESMKRGFGIPEEGTRWLHRMFVSNLMTLVEATGSDGFVVQSGFRIMRPAEPRAWKYEAVLDPDE